MRRPWVPAAIVMVLAVLVGGTTALLYLTRTSGPDSPPASPDALAPKRCRLYQVNGYRVLELAGTPEEMGRAHGQLLADDIRRVLADVLTPEQNPARYQLIRRGARAMEPFQPEPYRREMKALAEAVGVEYVDVVALQLFGDAERAAPAQDLEHPSQLEYQCTHYAAFGPATASGECIVGRNFDYWYEPVARYASIIIYYRPDRGHSFVTVSWAGVINGWTLMNDVGLVAAHNNAYGRSESTDGISTCFLQRMLIEEASSVSEAVELARRGPRAVGTVMLVAGGNPPDAADLEFDHDSLVVRPARNGYVIAGNGFLQLGRDTPFDPDGETWGRYGKLLELIRANYGRIDRSMNFAAVPGVAIESINLHSAVLFPADQTFLLSMGKVPASKEPYRRFRVTARGIVSAE